MSSLVLRSCGERAVLLELDDLRQVLVAADRIRSAVAAEERGFAEILDVVPAARTVLVALDDHCGAAELDGLRRALGRLDLTSNADSALTVAETVEVGVHYDGADLAEIAELTGLGETEVIAAHVATPWRVAFCGFAPGFAYLAGGDPRLRVPRRSSPRTTVPAGAVGLAGEFSAVYPRSSPGGWQLLGHTDLAIWDPTRDRAALLEPGTEVRFVEVGVR